MIISSTAPKHSFFFLGRISVVAKKKVKCDVQRNSPSLVGVENRLSIYFNHNYIIKSKNGKALFVLLNWFIPGELKHMSIFRGLW